MDESQMNPEEAFYQLNLSILFGADEAICETPRKRFNTKTLQDFEESSAPNRNLPKDKEILHKNDLHKTKFFSDEAYDQAVESAAESRSVVEIASNLRTFPLFVKNSEIEDINFYKGTLCPFVLILREPEIYNKQSDSERKLFDKELLFNEILNNIDIVIGKDNESVCGSLVTFPLHFDITEENKARNTKLMQPFLFQYINILRPKVIIQQGGPWLKISSLGVPLNNDSMQDTRTIDFPSLDVLGRAPIRKKDVWNKILEIKNIFELRKEYNDK